MTTIDLTEPANKLSELNRPNGEISGPDLGLDCLGVIRPILFDKLDVFQSMRL